MDSHPFQLKDNEHYNKPFAGSVALICVKSYAHAQKGDIIWIHSDNWESGKWSASPCWVKLRLCKRF